jgi:hypothetical protein
MVPTLYYRYYVFSQLGNPLKTSSSGILPLDGFHLEFKNVKTIVAIPLSYRRIIIYFIMVSI